MIGVVIIGGVSMVSHPGHCAEAVRYVMSGDENEEGIQCQSLEDSG